MHNQINLESLLSTHKFLEVVSSKSLYPNSKGTGLDILKVSTDVFEAHLSFQGAQILYFQQKSGSQLLWLSPNCDFTPRVALRGGIPICLPWFGPHPTDATKPKHGFTRIRDWQLTQVEQLDSQTVQLVFLFNHTADSLFSHNFQAKLVFTLSQTIAIELSVTHLSEGVMDCSFAFHSYHPVKNLATTKVIGLINHAYLDNLEDHTKKMQLDDVSFPFEVDRVFQNIQQPVELIGIPHLKIEQENCASVIVWNCGPSNAQRIQDIGAGNDQHYVCVERGNILEHKWLLASKSASATIKISEVAT